MSSRIPKVIQHHWCVFAFEQRDKWKVMKKIQKLVAVRKAFEAAEGGTLLSRQAIAAPLEDWINEDPDIHADQSTTLIARAEKAVEDAVETLRREKQSIDEETTTLPSSLRGMRIAGPKKASLEEIESPGNERNITEQIGRGQVTLRDKIPASSGESFDTSH